jgi:RimJ/RimL family protein N-acetyltransferase
VPHSTVSAGSTDTFSSPRLWATVWDWNTASRRVLAKIGFTETERKEVDPVRGTTLFLTKRL